MRLPGTAWMSFRTLAARVNHHTHFALSRNVADRSLDLARLSAETQATMVGARVLIYICPATVWQRSHVVVKLVTEADGAIISSFLFSIVAFPLE